MNKTIAHYQEIAIKTLHQSRITSAHLDADILLSFILKKPREFLYIHGDKKLTDRQARSFLKIISERKKYKPIAYIVGGKEFYGRNFYVDKRVLIPRPETELLVEEVLRDAKENKAIKNILDVGTGSGCIAITVGIENPQLSITAIDNSASALAVAKKNNRIHKTKIKFIHSNLLSAVHDNPDAIIANLPYVDHRHKNNRALAHELSLRHEPQSAIYAKDNGLALYKKLFTQIQKKHFTPQIILCEIDPRHQKMAAKMAKKYFPIHTITLLKDLAGKARILKISQ